MRASACVRACTCVRARGRASVHLKAGDRRGPLEPLFWGHVLLRVYDHLSVCVRGRAYICVRALWGATHNSPNARVGDECRRARARVRSFTLLRIFKKVPFF